MRQERLGRWLPISGVMITPIDTKVSIGTFVQLIRILISGSMKKVQPNPTGSRRRALFTVG